MKRDTVLGVLALLVLLVPLAALLLSCGGGGGSSSTGGTSTGTTTTGSVSVLLADGPASGYENIYVWITEVSLIPQKGNGRPVVIYENHQINDGHPGLKVDILAYRDEDFLLAVNHKVAPGVYAKIRLGISEIEPVGGPCASLDGKLPSGRIDLKPQEPFQVVPGGVLGIRLDMDANKSLNLHERGKGGKKGCIFRPVVFVDIEDRAPDGRCPKILGGTIKELVEEGGQTVGFKLDLIHDRGEIEVRLTPGTEIFDNTGFTNANALQTGQEVKVRGKFDSICRVVASLVVIGDVLDVTGEVYSAVNNGLIRFTPNLDEAVFPGQETNVGVTEGQTLILIDCDTAVSPSAIQPGMTARVFGKLVGVQNGSVLQAAVIFLRQKQVTGEIINLATDANGNKTAVIQQKDGAHSTVFIPATATVYIERDGTMSVDRLCVGQEVRVVLAPGSGNPPNAQVVYVEGARHEGQVVSVNTLSWMLVVQESDGRHTIDVPAGTTILLNVEVDDDKQILMDFNKIRAGDDIVYFGLPKCSRSGGFEVFVVVINREIEED